MKIRLFLILLIFTLVNVSYSQRWQMEWAKAEEYMNKLRNKHQRGRIDFRAERRTSDFYETGYWLNLYAEKISLMISSYASTYIDSADGKREAVRSDP